MIDDPISRHVVKLRLGITDEGNFESTKATVLSIVTSFEAIAKQLSLTVDEVVRRFESSRQALFEARERRPKPFRDEKILAGWNGLLLGGLAELGACTANPALIDAAERAFAHLERSLIDGGRVERFTTEDGFVARPGFLEDHASVANAALDLYEVTGKPAYAERARRIADVILERFADTKGGFFVSPSDGENLICRIKDAHDNATPSGSSLASKLMLRLGTMLGDPYASTAQKALESSAKSALDGPMGFGQTLLELDRLVRGSTDIVVVGASNDPATDALRKSALSVYVPARTLVSVDPSNEASLAVAKELAEGKPAGRAGQPVAYVCRDQTCSPPVTSPAELLALLKR
ncbi:MAG: hypothetical protein U0165_02815 [Polyangiaceae bacterium]